MKRWIHAAKDTNQQVDVSSIYVGQQVKDMSEVDPQVRIVKSVEPSVRGRYEVSFEDGSSGTYEVCDKFAIVSKTVEASSAANRISYLQERIDLLEEKLHGDNYLDPEERIDDQIELEELKEQLNFAWQDDEAEYNYALQQQEFNPDGSLRGYDDIYDSTKVTASSEWAASWDKRQDSGAPYYVMSVPSGTARVLPNDADGSRYHAEIKFRNGENRHSVAFESELDAMDWAENILFKKPINKEWKKGATIDTSTCVTASTTSLSDSKSDCQWMLDLYWDIDGHDHTITGVNGYPLLSCEVTEEWISADTGRPCKSKSWYSIREDENGHIYIQNKKNRNFKLYLNSAFNYKDLVPEEFDELDFLNEDYDEL